MREGFMFRHATVEEVALDLVQQLGKDRAWDLADRCANTTRSFAVRAFWKTVAEKVGLIAGGDIAPR